MRILFSANNFPTPQYPLQAFIGEICKELTRQGHDVTVIAPQSILSSIVHKIPITPFYYEESVNTQEGNKVIKVYRPKVLAPSNGGRLGFITRQLNRFVVNRTAKKIGSDFDVVYAHFWQCAINILDYVVATNLPFFVATGEDVIQIENLGNEKDRKVLSEVVKGVICVSTKNKIESIKYDLTKEEKCIVLPNSVNGSEFYKMDKMEIRKQLGIAPDIFAIAYCGRFNDRKGVFRVVDALNTLNDSTIKAIFIGMPIEGQKNYPEYSGIVYCGPLPHVEVAKYLNAADVFVLPTLAEGCSNSIVEAMACGLPIISSDLPFNHDILDDSNAILIDPMDVDAIADSIKSLKADVAKLERMARSSQNRSAALSIENRVEQIVSFMLEKTRFSFVNN